MGVLSEGLTDSSNNCCSSRSWEFKSLHFPKLILHCLSYLICILLPWDDWHCYNVKVHIVTICQLHALSVQWTLTSSSQKKPGIVSSRFLTSICLKHQRYFWFLFWFSWQCLFFSEPNGARLFLIVTLCQCYALWWEPQSENCIYLCWRWLAMSVNWRQYLFRLWTF